MESLLPGFHIVDKLNDVVVYWPKQSGIVDIIRVTKVRGKSIVLYLVVSSIRLKSEKTSCCAAARKCAPLTLRARAACANSHACLLRADLGCA